MVGGGQCMGNVFHSYVECLLKYMWRNYFCRKEGSHGSRFELCR